MGIPGTGNQWTFQAARPHIMVRHPKNKRRSPPKDPSKRLAGFPKDPENVPLARVRIKEGVQMDQAGFKNTSNRRRGMPVNLKYKKCPKCGAVLSKREIRGIQGRFIDHGKRLQYVQECPKCHQESYHFNLAGNADEGAWIQLDESGNPCKDVEMVLHSFEPFSVAECDNTACLECIFSSEEYAHDGSRYDCPQRKRLMNQGYQANLTAWGAC